MGVLTLKESNSWCLTGIFIYNFMGIFIRDILTLLLETIAVVILESESSRLEECIRLLPQWKLSSKNLIRPVFHLFITTYYVIR